LYQKKNTRKTDLWVFAHAVYQKQAVDTNIEGDGLRVTG
jgi:hypothetical protein